MATTKPLYASDVSLTFTSLNAGLTNGSAAGCLAVSNATNLYDDTLVSVTIATSTGTFTNGTVNVYAYGTTDGTHYTDGVTGTDASQTLTSPTNLKLIGVISIPAASSTFHGGPFSVAKAFGGNLPQSWGIVCVNNSGSGALASSGNSADYMGFNETIA